jgi:hypothetical protein
MCGGLRSVNVPRAERIDVMAAVAPGVYATTRIEVRRLADLGDPRVAMDENLTAAEKEAINATIPDVIERRALAARMDRGETVTVGWRYGRAFREITSMPWAPAYEGLVISADDVVRPADSGPPPIWSR